MNLRKFPNKVNKRCQKVQKITTAEDLEPLRFLERIVHVFWPAR